MWENDPDFLAYRNPPPGVDAYKTAVVALLDAKAQERRYDNAVSIATYVGTANPTWASEATAFVAWRDAVWAYAYAELDKVTQRPQSTVEASAVLAGIDFKRSSPRLPRWKH